MDFLLLLKISVVLSDTLERQLVHEVDEFGHRNILALEALDRLRVGRREKTDLLLLWHELNDLCNDDLEVVTQQLVDLVKHKHFAILKFGDVLACKV